MLQYNVLYIKHITGERGSMLNFIRGFCMALADSVPGVSGGTVAFLLGFYDKFIMSLDYLMSGTKEERIVGTHPGCSIGCNPARARRLFGNGAQCDWHGSQRRRLFVGKQGAAGKAERCGTGQEPVDSRRKPDCKRPDRSSDFTLVNRIKEYTLYIIRYEIK